MPDRQPEDETRETLTTLLRAWAQGDERAGEQLFPMVYEDLRRQAARYMRHERPGHTLQPTALAHEAYLRLAGARGLDWTSRAHFFAMAARVMRRILVDHARKRRARKRDGGRLSPVEADLAGSAGAGIDVLDLDRALGELAEIDPGQARVVELRYFGGLSVEETAEVLELSPRTIKREWQTARAWLQHRLKHARRNPW